MNSYISLALAAERAKDMQSDAAPAARAIVMITQSRAAPVTQSR